MRRLGLWFRCFMSLPVIWRNEGRRGRNFFVMARLWRCRTRCTGWEWVQYVLKVIGQPSVAKGGAMEAAACNAVVLKCEGDLEKVSAFGASKKDCWCLQWNHFWRSEKTPLLVVEIEQKYGAAPVWSHSWVKLSIFENSKFFYAPVFYNFSQTTRLAWWSNQWPLLQSLVEKQAWVVPLNLSENNRSDNPGWTCRQDADQLDTWRRVLKSIWRSLHLYTRMGRPDFLWEQPYVS